MLAATTYPKDHVDAAREKVDAQIAAYRKAVKPGDPFDAVFFNDLLIVLDAHFLHRGRGQEGKDGNALNESRVLCSSLITHGGVFMPDKTIKLKPEASVLGHAPGDTIALDEAGFRALAAAFLTEIEVRFPAHDA